MRRLKTKSPPHGGKRAWQKVKRLNEAREKSRAPAFKLMPTYRWDARRRRVVKPFILVTGDDEGLLCWENKKVH